MKPSERAKQLYNEIMTVGYNSQKEAFQKSGMSTYMIGLEMSQLFNEKEVMQRCILQAMDEFYELTS